MTDTADQFAALAACPFCANEAPFIVKMEPCYPAFVTLYTVRCACGAQTKTSPDRADAIAAWNTRALRAGDGWREIATAPKDGSEVMLWVDGDEESPRKGHWEQRLDEATRGHCWCVAYGWCEDKPTHWRPLPPPPGAADEGEKT